jgi:hypothetical protein
LRKGRPIVHPNGGFVAALRRYAQLLIEKGVEQSDVALTAYAAGADSHPMAVQPAGDSKIDACCVMM